MASDNTKLDKGGVPSRDTLRIKALSLSPKMIDILSDIAQDKSKQDSVRVSAASKIVDKAMPNMQATELTGKDGNPIQFGYIKDFISSGGWNVPASIGGTEGSNEVQSNSLAPKSQENNNSLGKGESGSAQRPEENILGSVSNQNPG